VPAGGPPDWAAAGPRTHNGAVGTSFRNGALAGFLAWQVAALQAVLLNQLGDAPGAVALLAVVPGLVSALLGGSLGLVAGILVPRRRAIAAPMPAVLLLLAALGRTAWTGTLAARRDLLLGPTVQAFSLGLVAVGLVVVFLLLRRGPVTATLLAAGAVVVAGGLLARPDRGSPLPAAEADTLLDPALPPAPVLLLALPGLPPAALETHLEADRGRAPGERRLANLEALLRRGSRAPLEPFRPPDGPVFWTTLATGARWTEHGIHGEALHSHPLLGSLDLGGTMIEGLPALLADRLGLPGLALGPPRPPAPEARSRPALWEVLGRGRHVPVVVSWPLFPAGQDGPAVLLDPTAFRDGQAPAATVSPATAGALDLPSLVASLAAPERREEYRQEARRFLGAAELEPAAALVEALVRFQARRDFAYVVLEELSQDPHRPPVLVLRETLLVDAVPPPGGPLEEALLDLLDLTLGNLLVRLEGDPRVLLLLPGTAPGEPGLVVAAGGPFRSGALLPALGAEDVAPTLLHSLGLPAAADCSGRPEPAWFRADFLRDHPPRLVASWQVRSARP